MTRLPLAALAAVLAGLTLSGEIGIGLKQERATGDHLAFTLSAPDAGGGTLLDAAATLVLAPGTEAVRALRDGAKLAPLALRFAALGFVQTREDGTPELLAQNAQSAAEPFAVAFQTAATGPARPGSRSTTRWAARWPCSPKESDRRATTPPRSRVTCWRRASTSTG